jgi:hypothetical protein
MSWCTLGGRRISWLFIVNIVVGLRPRWEVVMAEWAGNLYCRAFGKVSLIFLFGRLLSFNFW